MGAWRGRGKDVTWGRGGGWGGTSRLRMKTVSGSNAVQYPSSCPLGPRACESALHPGCFPLQSHSLGTAERAGRGAKQLQARCRERAQRRLHHTLPMIASPLLAWGGTARVCAYLGKGPLALWRRLAKSSCAEAAKHKPWRGIGTWRKVAHMTEQALTCPPPLPTLPSARATCAKSVSGTRWPNERGVGTLPHHTHPSAKPVRTGVWQPVAQRVRPLREHTRPGAARELLRAQILSLRRPGMLIATATLSSLMQLHPAQSSSAQRLLHSGSMQAYDAPYVERHHHLRPRREAGPNPHTSHPASAFPCPDARLCDGAAPLPKRFDRVKYVDTTLNIEKRKMETRWSKRVLATFQKKGVAGNAVGDGRGVLQCRGTLRAILKTTWCGV
eukprot:TRINITY_DN2979_c0_g4_i1.p1 TRINITY_DN2979_c0_g4~~TRINITY_DN2979_c0_g4_i1.p1  ORF type:complete len:386 (-),score=-90.06 TRINITY_DN2979_c0_g4_i1:417-1574(-)